MNANQYTKPTLLIVDDEPSNIKLLINALGNQNYHIRVATNGMKALEIIFGSQTPDLVLLDIVMPEVDGYHVCQEIKQHTKYQNIPIIFLTDKDESVDEEKGLLLGAVDYISKPFHIPILKARVKTHIELKFKSDLLERYASIDQLTNIPNRRQFEEKLQNEWQRCLRTKSPVSLIMMDIDFFKQYNDNYGNPTGDNCLKQAAKALCEHVRRPGDVIARYGGEEFVAMLPTTDKKGAVKIALDMQLAIRSLKISHEHSSVADIITMSFGIGTIIPAADLKPEQLIEHADTMLNSAKNAGRNTIKSSEYTPS